MNDKAGDLYIISEYFALGALDVQLEIWEERLSVGVRIALGQQICLVSFCLFT